MKEKEKPKMMQNVIITFKDGQKAVFTGPATVFQGEEKVVSNIIFTNPKPLPSDCEWGKL
jgi:hypothetical protein